jgi:aspartate ammonia-lyase
LNRSFRIEKDFLGEKNILQEVYWGIHTERVRKNFGISGYKLNPSLIKALGVVKKACARANLE